MFHHRRLCFIGGRFVSLLYFYDPAGGYFDHIAIDSGKSLYHISAVAVFWSEHGAHLVGRPGFFSSESQVRASLLLWQGLCDWDSLFLKGSC